MSASLPAVALYFLRLGLTGFGGPVALAHYMRRDLVDRYGWILPEEYDEGLAIATACPGPLAYQLGVYCGYILHGTAGALTVAVAFAAAPFLLVTAFAMLYVQYGSTRILQGLFYGVEPVVVALIVRSCWDLGRKTLRSEWLAYAVAATACVITVVLQQELVAIFLIAGALGIVIFYRPNSDAGRPPQPRTAGRDVALKGFAPLTVTGFQTVAPIKLFLFFFKTGFLIFGSGLVVVPFLKAYVVDQYHWITNRAFLDAVAVGIVSPGPVVITATFVGYLTHHISGAAAATAGIFAPSIIFVLLGTPLLRRYRRNGRVQGFIRGITVAVVGVLVGTSYLVGRSIVHDAFTLVLLIGALAVLLSKLKVPEVALVAAGAAFGLLSAFWGLPARAETASTNVLIVQPWSHGQLRSGFTITRKAKGSCFSNALTTNRLDAWRCFIGNDIYDPCFSGSAHAAVVACADDPFSRRVILLSLQKPLNSGESSTTEMLQPKGEPWGLRLANGETCTFVTGATDVVQGMRMNYECKANDFIVGFPNRSKSLWTAHAVVWPDKKRLKQVEIAAAVF
ncbi:MAG: chromate efflux transporter [Candidatus Eremiobacteraeota bacterium]|nr:chromate efflux transporter [Candidatus Eremiobacteraeota bacterium]